MQAMEWKNQLTRTPYLVLFIILISVGVGTASALITITLAGNVVVTDDLLVQGDVSVDGTITGALNVYTVQSPNLVLAQGGSTFTNVHCSDNNDIALDGSYIAITGDGSSMNVITSQVIQAVEMSAEPAHYFAGLTNNAPGSVTMKLDVICLEVPGTQ